MRVLWRRWSRSVSEARRIELPIASYGIGIYEFTHRRILRITFRRPRLSVRNCCTNDPSRSAAVKKSVHQFFHRVAFGRNAQKPAYFFPIAQAR